MHLKTTQFVRAILTGVSDDERIGCAKQGGAHEQEAE